MKKYLLLIAIALLSFPAFSQDKDDDDDKVEFFKQDPTSGDYYYEEIVKVEGQKKEVMYERAKNWIIANFKTGDNNIKFDDKEYAIDNSAAIKIDVKSFITYVLHEGAYNFKFHVWFKDDRYKVRVDNIMYYTLTSDGKIMTPHTYAHGDLKKNKFGRYLKKQSTEKTEALIYVFKKAVLSQQSTPTKQSDW